MKRPVLGTPPKSLQNVSFLFRFFGEDPVQKKFLNNSEQFQKKIQKKPKKVPSPSSPFLPSCSNRVYV